MNITIIGAGNAGTTIAADLTHKGHDVTLLKTSDKLHNENFAHLLATRRVAVEDGAQAYEVTLCSVTTDVEQALSNAELVILYVQTNYHQQVIRRIQPYIKDGQTFLIEPGYLSSCFFLQETKKDITIIEAESSPIDCRIIAPGRVRVLFRNVLNPFGVYPKREEARARRILDQLRYPYILTKNVVEAALHNPNVIVHTTGALFSIPRIEKTNGDYWMYKEVFTPHIWNVVTHLDEEKMTILERLGCPRLPYVEACKMRNSADASSNALDVFFDYAQNGSPYGPTVPDSRYLTEDVPEGLCLIESLGKYFGIATPTATAIINLANAALNTDFRQTGRTVERLGLKNIERILQDIE
ncbi:MAG: NAD/NADP octopine/nopaline dehydrogenase family protein [Ndongobacter sp.]|nr:NAD/NADP octopine/nopaline dehydrogenase family protein [Ndongobacter sp.]